MKCCKCQAEISGRAKFCPQCGCALPGSTNLRESCITDLKACENSIRDGKESREYLRKNFDTRLSDWKQAAELGFWQAQWLLGRCYDEGFGVEMNTAKAVSWHLKAAEQGYAPSQNYIGCCYQDGDGLPQDKTEAVKWYRKAAEQGYALAQCYLGCCYDLGSGVAIDEEEAVKWFLLAAQQGDYTSQVNLGVHYERGKGVVESKQEALKWYHKAADEGYERSRQALQRLENDLAAERKTSQEQARKAAGEFRRACKEALADGKLTVDEADKLKSLAKSPEMSGGVAKQIFAEEKKIFHEKQKVQHARDAERRFRIACRNALSDRKVTLHEKDELIKLAKLLKMSGEITKQIFEEEKKIFLESRRKKQGSRT